MKKLRFLCLSMMVALAGIFFVACDDDNEKTVTIKNESGYKWENVVVYLYDENSDSEKRLGTIADGEQKSFSADGYFEFFIICDINGTECESPDYDSSITVTESEIMKWPLAPESGSEPGVTKREIIGTWVCIRDEGYEKYQGEKDSWNETYEVEELEGLITFYSNGTCIGGDNEGTWKLINNKLTVTLIEDDDEYTQIYIVLELNSDNLVVEQSEKDNEYEFYNKMSFVKINV